MAKYLFLKHYRGAPPMATDVPMSEWAPDAVEAHIQFMRDFADRLVETGEFVDGQALAPDGMWVRHDGAGRLHIRAGLENCRAHQSPPMPGTENCNSEGSLPYSPLRHARPGNGRAESRRVAEKGW